MSGSDTEHPSKRKKLAAHETPTKSPEPDFSEPDTLVTFLIGPDEVKFRVHKEFVVFHSPVLKAAFSSSFVEGQTQTYKIVDTSPGCFKFFVQWIYGQRLDVKQLKPDFEKEALGALDPDWVDKEDMMLAELWVFADKFAIPRLQNKCIESMLHILAGCSNMLPLPTMKYIYGNTSPESQLRKFATHQCYHMDAERWVNNSEYFPHELLFDHVILAAKVQSGEKKAPPQISKLKASDYFVPVEEVLNRRITNHWAEGIEA